MSLETDAAGLLASLVAGRSDAGALAPPQAAAPAARARVKNAGSARRTGIILSKGTPNRWVDLKGEWSLVVSHWSLVVGRWSVGRLVVSPPNARQGGRLRWLVGIINRKRG